MRPLATRYALARRAPVLVALLTVLLPGARAGEGTRPSVLLICVDDLRPDLGHLGVEHARTPAIDRLAATGRSFARHYVQVPTCGASRHSMLTGRYPQRRVHLGNGAFDHLDPDAEVESLPHLFRRAGYRTAMVGKVGHAQTGIVLSGGELAHELPRSWDEVALADGPWQGPLVPLFAYADGSHRARGESPTTERGPRGARYPDAFVADRACELLDQAREREQPFFLAVGFYKPHLPFTAPEECWELFDAEPPPPAPWDRAPLHLASQIGLHDGGELLRNYGSHPEGNGPGLAVTEEYAARLRQGYAASVAWVDGQVGRVLEHLESSGLAGDTIVVLWGDHGWHLGDQGLWGKHSLFERALHSPLILRAPGQAAPGEVCDAVVESVDLYPTLAELCGLEVPADLDGQSLVPCLRDPAAATDGLAVSFWSKGRTLGRGLRTDRHRYVRWTREGRFVAEELYDHAQDPHETRNVAPEEEALVAGLLELLAARAPARDLER